MCIAPPQQPVLSDTLIPNQLLLTHFHQLLSACLLICGPFLPCPSPFSSPELLAGHLTTVFSGISSGIVPCSQSHFRERQKNCDKAPALEQHVPTGR